MARVNLSIDDNVFAKIKREADDKSTTVNLLIIDILENLYGNENFNYSVALKTLVDEAEAYVKNPCNDREFTLLKLPSFSEICVAKAGAAKIQPSMIRARLGKMFNTMVRSGSVKGVSRAIDEKGNLKFIEKTVVYTANKNAATD